MLAIENPSVAVAVGFLMTVPFLQRIWSHLGAPTFLRTPASSTHLRCEDGYYLNWGGISFLEGTPFCNKRIILS
jgi:hypothetical protein